MSIPESQALAAVAQFVLNPVTIATLVSRPHDLVANLLLAAVYVTSAYGLTLCWALSLALFASAAPLQGACIAIPSLLLLSPRSLDAAKRSPSALRIACREFASFGALAIVSRAGVVKGVIRVDGRLASPLEVDFMSLWPELSPWWYLLSLAFLHQLPYHRVLTLAHPLAYVVPLCVRLRKRPEVALISVACLACLFDPTSSWTLARLPLCISLALLAQDVVREMRGCYLWLGLLALPVAVSPLMKLVWLRHLSGNANFLFNQQLIFTVAGGSLVAEFVAAALRLERRDRASAKAKA